MRKLSLALAALAAVACTDATAPTLPTLTAPPTLRPAIIVNETTPSALVTPNPCNGDVVALTGQTHIVLGHTTSPGGQQTFYYDLTGTYSGIGAPSLFDYRGYFNQHRSFLISDPYPIVDTFFDEIKVTSQSGSLNYTIRVHAKVTINQNAAVAVEFLDTTVRCDGPGSVVPPVSPPGRGLAIGRS